MKEQEIRLLEDREHCRLRRGMYIPNVNYFVYELVDNCVDQFMAGYGDTINVLIEEDGSLMVQDFGQGMPIAESKDIKGMSQVELALSRLQAGGKFEDNGVKSSGLNGVGASCINFLSEYFLVRISKQEDSILLEFIRQTKKDDQGHTRLPGFYSIRFRTSGSTYTPCDLVFTRHFLKMQEYDFEAPQQIHIEELLYRDKQLKKKR